MVETMKKAKQMDQSPNFSVSEGVAPAKNSSNDWQDDDVSEASAAEENWCIVSDDDVQKEQDDKPIPKGNVWWDEETEEEETSFVDMLKQTSMYQKLPPNLQNPKNLLLMLHLILGLLIILHLAWDRYSWRSSAMRLDEELRNIKAEPPIVISTPPQVMADKDPLFTAAEDSENGFSEWRKEKEKHSDVILDNCWVYAKASVSFRECAEDAKDTLQDFSTEVVKTAKTFAKHTWKAAKKFKKHLVTAAAAEAERRRDQPY